MSYIQFESAREKDKARQDLREVREQMLKEAKKRAEENANYNVKRALKGEVNWMLPSVEKKFEVKNREIKKYKKKDEKGSKKTKKRSSKKRKYSSSDTDTDSSDSNSTSSSSTSSSSEEEKKKRKISKKIKKSVKVKKSLGSVNEEIKKEKESCNVKEHVKPIIRDSWMTSPLMLKTYVKERKEHKPNENENTAAYDPTKSIQEINPYWKLTGTGLPSFLKPKDDDDYDFQPKNSEKSLSSATKTSSKGWRKERAQNTSPRREKKSTYPSDASKSFSGDDNGKYETESKTNYLTDEQMNKLGAKLLKAELTGNMSFAEELRQNMETARRQRSDFKELQKQSIFMDQSVGDKRVKEAEEHIILTHTDKVGCTRPLPISKVTDTGDKRNQRQKQRHVKTHNEYGERVRYFADDDRYNLKEMFEKEKFTTASEANLQFANIVSKHKNPNDDMEDIFAEKICKDDSVSVDQKERQRAIREHQNTEKVLDNCDKCFDSTKMQKERLVCVGEKVYLALPWYQGLQEGHCVIIPNQHVSCCTQLDEDTWSEINEFRKALTRMFTAQRKDVIFFEIANRLHKRLHLVIHCIPIRESDGEMAPFYFKKAIEESEHDWCINKQLVSLRHKSLLSCIPKGLPYFWVNFGMDTGFAHVIEDEDRFPANFAQEIIGGMLNLDTRKWRNLRKEQNTIAKVKIFAEMWKKYDCTV